MKTVTSTISLVVGLTMIIEYYFKMPVLSQFAALLQNWVVIMSAFAIGLGFFNLLRVHTRNVQQKKPRWDASVVLLVFLIGTLVIGQTLGMNSPLYNYIFGRIYTPLVQSSSGLLIFFIITAALRAFRLRNTDAWFLLVSCILVMLGNAPFGTLISAKFPTIKEWIIAVPNMAGQRAIGIGASLGIIATALRTILGLEVTQRSTTEGAGPS